MDVIQHNKDVSRMKELVQKINAASDAYYGSGTELMPNHEWDGLYDELVRLEERTGIIMSNSPTQNVGPTETKIEKASGFEKIEHEISVKSLDKTKDVDALAAFIGEHPGILSWKLDGLTVVLTYDNGRLEKAVTRGRNGIGELITENARHMIGVPEKIPFTGRLNVRGEALISYEDFEIVNASLPEGEEEYKNPRNLAAGTIRQTNSMEVAKRRVRFVAFSSDHYEEYHHVEFEWLRICGFDVVNHVTLHNGKTVSIGVETFRGLIKQNPYPSDGLVLQFDQTAYGRSLGETNKFPRDAIAFKWQDEEKETEVKEIFWSPSRTGLINPVVVFEPIELEGTTVERASVHNVSILEQLSITPGDTITVYKANMIIPQVSENLTMLNKPMIPDTCPACGGPTVIRTGKDNCRRLYCENPDCSAKHIKLFTHAVKRDALDIAGLSEETLKDFIEAGILHTLPDLFRLGNHMNTIMRLPGYGAKSAENIKKAIEAARTTTVQKLIYACGIEFVGRTASKAICKHFAYQLPKILTASKEELLQIEGIGEVIADSYVNWFGNTLNQEMFDDFLSEVTLTVPEVKQAAVKEGKPGIAGKTIVITGDVRQFENRNAFKAWVEENGGKVTGSVSKNTDFLVTNTPNSGTSKNKKAQELGVAIITEQEILDMVQ